MSAPTGPAWQQGRWGERSIKKWFQGRGFFVIPAADIENGGAPMLEGAYAKAILPDLMVSVRGHSRWVEIKTKTNPTFYEKKRRYEHGVELRHWIDYLACEQQTGIEGWLCIWELKRNLVLLQKLSHLDGLKRIYTGGHMPDMVFWADTDFEWHWGPDEEPPAPPIQPLAPRTIAQPEPPAMRQLRMSL